MSTSRTVAAGAAWLYGAQAIVVVFQFGYAALTSRIVSPEGFGAYGAALATMALVALLATGGLAPVMSRMAEIDAGRVRAVALASGGLGLVAMATLLVGAPAAAAVWGIADAVPPIRTTAAIVVVLPFSAVAMALARRAGRFRRLAVLTAGAGVCGLAVGAVVVAHYRTADSLLVAQITTQWIIAIGAAVSERRHLFGRPDLRHFRRDIGFSNRVTVSKVISYASGVLPKIVGSSTFGASLLGQWNRAEVVSSVPLQQVLTAFQQALYPEFRHDIDDNRRARRVWTDLLGMLAWLVLPAGAWLIGTLPVVVPVLFGGGWELAVVIAQVLVLYSAMQLVNVVLSTALEALGWFTVLWTGQTTVLVIVAVTSGVSAWTGTWWVLLVGPPLSIVIQHGIYTAAAAKRGYLDSKTLARSYWGAGAVALVVWGGVASVTAAGHDAAPGVRFALACAVLLLAAGAAWLTRRRLPPYQVAMRYGLLSRPK